MSDLRDSETSPDATSVKGHMVRGAAWMVSMRWSLKLIGLVNTVIIARLLAPDDFGVIAMAMIVVGFLTEISETNVAIALIRKQDAGRDDYDSAWTLKILVGALLTAILIALAPVVANFYGDERVGPVIQIVAFRCLLNGFENIGVVDFRKQMQFAKEFRYWLYRRLTDIVLALSLVFWLRDYHALAFAMVASSCVTIAYSFAMSRYRPHISFAKFRELWSVSQWLMFDHGSRFIGRRVDEFVLGATAGSTVVGNYYMASEISTMPTREVVLPAGRALVPTFAKVSHDEDESRRAYLQVFGLTALYALPAGVGMSIVAPDLVPLLLGAQWGAAIPFFQWLGLFAALEAIYLGTRPYFLAHGGERAFALASIVYACLLVPAVVAAGSLSEPIGIAVTRTGMMLLMVLALLVVVARLRYAGLGDQLALIWRPAIASACMWIGIDVLPELSLGGHALALARDVVAGSAIFVGTCLLLWFAVRKPDGPERDVLAFVRRKTSRPSD